MPVSFSAKTQLFVNGNVLTLDPDFPQVDAFAVVDGRVVDVGANGDILALRESGSQVVDLKRRTVVPGFNDSHMHLLSWGMSLDAVDLSTADSPQALVELGRTFAQKHQELKWISGRGWSDELFSAQFLPTAADLDAVGTDRPVVFTRVCGHLCVVNSAALRLAGIDASTPNPPGGQIDKDPVSGEPTGILREKAMDLILRHAPVPDGAALKRALLKAAAAASAFGLTSVQTNDITDLASMQMCLSAYQQLVQTGELPIRINLQVGLPTKDALQQYVKVWRQYRYNNSMFHLGPVKLFADGSLGAHTAALNAPYADDPTTHGICIYQQSEFDELVQTAASAGLQVAVHAIGDRAMDMVLNSYEHVFTHTANARRPRIIHAQITSPSNLRRMAALGVVADIQPIFVPTDLHFAEQRVGAERAANSYAWKTMVDMGIPVAMSSDCPVESCRPLDGLYAAVTRMDQTGFPAQGWNPSERLTALEALKAYTIGSAYACHEENSKGSLTPGKLADFVVLPEDPTRVSPEALLSLPVSATYVGGCQVFGQ